MNNKASVLNEISQRRAIIDSLQKELCKEEEPLLKDTEYIKLCRERDELNSKLQRAPRPTAPVLPTIGIVIGVIAVLISLLTTIYLFIGGVVFITVFGIISSKNMKKQQKEIDKKYAPTKDKYEKLTKKYNEMRSSYPGIKNVETKIAKAKSELATWEKELARIQNEEEALRKAVGTSDPYILKNHVFIHVGKKHTGSHTPGLLKNDLIIDGISYGPAPLASFTKFEMNPGLHSLVVKYQSGESIYSLNPIQFRADNNSQFIAVKYINNYNIEIKHYDNLTEFLAFLNNY